MPRPTHILDTSAILAHYFDEPGAEEMEVLWSKPGIKLGIYVLTIPELQTRLRAEVNDEAEIEQAFHLYVDQLTVSFPVDIAIAHEAGRLRESCSSRLPLVDACIAACAGMNGCILVHRDPHMSGLAPGQPEQLQLPGKIR